MSFEVKKMFSNHNFYNLILNNHWTLVEVIDMVRFIWAPWFVTTNTTVGCVKKLSQVQIFPIGTRKKNTFSQELVIAWMVACGSFASYGSWDNLFHLFCNHTLHNKNVLKFWSQTMQWVCWCCSSLALDYNFSSAVSTFNNFPISISWRSQRLLQSVR